MLNVQGENETGETPRHAAPPILRAGGVLAGCALIYATVELWSTELLRRLISPGTFITTHRPFLLASLTVFVIVGFLAGLAVAAALRRRPTPPWREIGTLLLVIVAGTNVLVHRQLSILPVAVIAACLLCATSIALTGDEQRRRLFVWTSPWTASMFIVLPDWIANDLFVNESYTVRGTAFLISVAGLAAGAFLVSRSRTQEERPWKRVAIGALVISATVATTFSIRERAPRELPVSTPGRRVPGPNVLLITLDTVRADHLSIYGYERETTPSLARFLTGSTLYQAAIAPASFTLATHASLFTGLYPSEHRAYFEKGWPAGRPLDGRIVTLAEILTRRGYETSAVAANFAFLGADHGLDRGFGFHSSRPGANIRAAFLHPRIDPMPHSGLKKHLLGHAVRSLLCDRLDLFRRVPVFVSATDITRDALARIDQANRARRPFFLFLNYMDAHDPCFPPPPYDTRFPGSNPEAARSTLHELEHVWRHTGQLGFSRSARAHFTSQYDGAIRYMDHNIGLLIESLRDRGIYDDTLIVVTSDHGEAFGEHDMIAHGSSTFNEQVRVPLIVKLPRQRTGLVVPEPVSLVQTFSLIESAGKQAMWTPSQIVAESQPQTRVSPTARVSRNGRAIVRGDFKLIRSSQGHPDELYNLRDDPGETRNLTGADPQRAATLRDALDNWIRTHPPRYTMFGGRAVSHETEAQLRAIGYIH